LNMRGVSSENSRALVDRQARPWGPGIHNPRSCLFRLAWPPPQQDDAATHYHVGDTLREKGQLDGAIAEWGKAILQRANYPEATSAIDKGLEAKRKSGP